MSSHGSDSSEIRELEVFTSHGIKYAVTLTTGGYLRIWCLDKRIVLNAAKIELPTWVNPALRADGILFLSRCYPILILAL